MSDNIDFISIKKLEVNNDKVVIKDITLEDLEFNFLGKVIKINKVKIDELELDKFNLV